MSRMVSGDPRSPYLFILMAPGGEEIKNNEMLVGGSGKHLWSLAKRAGIDRSECYCINTVGCWPNGLDGNPTAYQYNKYWRIFDYYLHQSTARVMVCFGKSALFRTLGCPDGVEAWRGYIVTPEEVRAAGWKLTRERKVWTAYKTNSKNHKKGEPRLVRVKDVYDPFIPSTVQTIIPSLHPAAVLRSGFTTSPVLGEDLKRVKRAGQGMLTPIRRTYVEYPVMASKAEPRAFDIEGVGVVDRIGIANGLETWTVPWSDKALGATRSELSRTDCVKVAHNIAFDLPILEAAGVQIPDPIWDTMLAAAMLQPDIPKGLKYVAPMYLDVHQWDRWRHSNMAAYNAGDASATLALYHVLRAELAQTGQLSFFESTIMPTIRILTEMTRRGIKVDTARRQAWVNSLNTDLIRELGVWQTLTGCNPFSPKQLASYLYGPMGLDLPLSYNKYGKTSTEEAVLQQLRVDYPQHADKLELLLKLRGLKKDLKTYADVSLGADGCVHPSYLPAGKDSEKVDPEGNIQSKGLAGTWRITARNPNIQNQPKEARKMFVPHRAGLKLVELDYDQIEARIIATMSGDDNLTKAISNGLHTSNMDLLGVDKTRAKNAFYGWSYGAGAPTLVKTFRQAGFSVTQSDARAMLRKFDQTFWKAAQWRQRVMEAAEASNYVENPFGLRRYFYRRGQGPAAANYLPQSTAAGIMWAILKPIAEYCQSEGGALLATVHDSILVELPKDHGVMGLMNIMEVSWPQIAPGFHVPVSVKIGQNWGELV